MARINFYIVSGNTAPSYVLTCTRDGEVLSLATATDVDVILQQKSTNTITNTGHQAADITTPASGIITYTAEAGDFPAAGRYVADIKITYTGGGIEILYNQAVWRVRNKIT